MKKFKFFKPIISRFPRTENLTEVSILSFYEIVFYLVIFLFCFMIYKSWTKIPIRTIEIECERIDTTKLYAETFQYDSINKIKIKTKGLPATTGYIHITIPNSTVGLDSIENPKHIETHFSVDKLHYLFCNIEDSTFYMMRKLYNKRLDSLFAVYQNEKSIFLQKKNFSSELDSTAIFYQKIKIDNNLIRICRPLDNQTDSLINYYSQIFHEHHKFYTKIKYKNNIRHTQIGSMKTQYEMFMPEGVDPGINEYGGVFDKPNKFDNFDISQSYYRIIFKTNTIDTTHLILHFKGANDFIYVRGEIPKILSAQNLEYKILNHDWRNKDIILHVKSRELEVIQNSRMFIITAILSGLIIIFITFIIIFCYRLFRIIRMKKRKRDNSNSSNMNEQDSIVSDNSSCNDSDEAKEEISNKETIKSNTENPIIVNDTTNKTENCNSDNLKDSINVNNSDNSKS